MSAYEQGQRLKLRGALIEARAELAICARDPCPATFQPECLRWLDEANRAVPSIVPEVRGADGNDRDDVRVTIDGHRVTDRLDGSPIELDPGEHVVRLEATGAPAVERRVMLAEGEKARRVQVVLEAPSAEISPSMPTTRSRPVPLGTWIAGGVAFVALGSFATFGIKGAVDHGDLNACRGTGCPPSEVDNDRLELRAADISLAVAVVSAGVGALLFLTRPEVTITPAVSPRAGSITAALRF